LQKRKIFFFLQSVLKFYVSEIWKEKWLKKITKEKNIPFTVFSKISSHFCTFTKSKVQLVWLDTSPGVLQHSSYNFSSSRLKSELALSRKNKRSSSYSPRIFNVKRMCLSCLIKVYTLQPRLRIAATKVSFCCWRRLGRRRTLDLALPWHIGYSPLHLRALLREPILIDHSTLAAFSRESNFTIAVKYFNMI